MNMAKRDKGSAHRGGAMRLTTCVALLAARAGLAGVDFADSNMVTMKFDDACAVSSIVEHETGRELVAETRPFVAVRLADGRVVVPESCEKQTRRLADGRSENHIVFIFPDGAGAADFAVIPFSLGWEIRLDAVTVGNAERVEWGRISPVCREKADKLANMFSDGKSGVCLRAFDEGVSMDMDGGFLRVSASRVDGPFRGRRSGLVACPRRFLVRSLRTMTSFAGLPHAFAGGAWADDAGTDTWRTPVVAAGDWRSDFDDLFSVAWKAHAAGLKCGVRVEDWPLSDDDAARFAKVFETCRMDMVEFGGRAASEGGAESARARRALFSRLGWRERPITVVAASAGPHDWCVLSHGTPPTISAEEFGRRYAMPAEKSATTKVQFWFDTEDYTLPKSNDGLLELARTLTDEGVRGHFNVAGYLAKAIQDQRRLDVVDALRPHLVGSQSLYHSVHPNITEMSDLENYDKAYHLVLAEEAQTVGMLRAVLGHEKMWFSVWPGAGSSYVACDVAADLGMHFHGGLEAIEDGRPRELGQCWYLNQRHICYNAPIPLESLMPGRFEKLDLGKVLDEAAKCRLVAFAMHPHFINRPRSWDVDSYAYGNNVEFGRFFDTELVPEEKSRGFFANLRTFIRRIKSDARFEFVDCEQLSAMERPRRSIAMRDIPAIRARLMENFGPISEPASWCVADVFHAVVALLRGEERHVPGRVYGFLDVPKGVAKPVKLTAADLKAAAARMSFDRHIPPSFRVGDVEIGPADFLFSALEALATGAEEVVAEPREQLGDIAGEIPSLATFSHIGRWIFSRDFKDNYLSDRLRWQYWTLRYE